MLTLRPTSLRALASLRGTLSLALSLPLAVALSACGDDGGAATTLGTGGPSLGDDTSPTGGADDDPTATDDGNDSDGLDDDTSGDTGPMGSGACILNNCEFDEHCDGCPDGANICDTDQSACVQCDPENQIGCEAGEMCTEFGNCVPEGLECPTADGLPAIDCDTDDDCAACAPQFQSCFEGACTACNDDSQGNCQATELCEAGECVSACPESCLSDSECSSCGTEGNEAHACHNHECAECSDSFPCPEGEQCTDQGVCIEICGIPGEVTGTCESDADCAGCTDALSQCALPINGGHGSCGPEATGCSDLGDGVVLLPEPFDAVTNTCSNDGDCDGIGVVYNVGELLREITGIDGIGDANIDYPMARCAELSIDIGDDTLACGVCVPCEVDDDCMDIDINEVADDAFGPLGAIAAAILLDQLFGDEEQLIHMFCQPVVGGLGICAPCPTLLNDCTATPPGGGSGTCDHDVCTEGTPLDPECGACAAAVCAVDDFCCSNMWDGVCVNAVEDECAGSCDGGGGGCDHGQCEEGEPLDPTCGVCVSAICSADPFCCQTAWDATCVNAVADECGGDCGGGECSHSPCQQGGPLPDDCSPCASDVCNADDFCCSTDWDGLCVDQAIDLCAECVEGGCAHDECLEGGPLEEACSPCAAAVCGADDFCCTMLWDNFCVDAAVADAACSC